jgi:hypothetical protein
VILEDVMEELAAALGTIPGLRATPFPTMKPNVPQGMVMYPTRIDYDQTFGRGMDSMEIPVVVVVGITTDLSTRKALSFYCDGKGAKSVKAALEVRTYTAMDEVQVVSVEFLEVTYNGIPYLAAEFTLNIAGQGA